MYAIRNSGLVASVRSKSLSFHLFLNQSSKHFNWGWLISRYSYRNWRNKYQSEEDKPRLTNGYEVLAKIFLRYKNLFLAMKRKNYEPDDKEAMQINSMINNISKLSKKILFFIIRRFFALRCSYRISHMSIGFYIFHSIVIHNAEIPIAECFGHCLGHYVCGQLI